MKQEDISKDKEQLYKSLSAELSDFEKNFLLISAGVLTFSITFIKDIVNLSNAIFLPLLFTSWILIGLSVALMMVTFIVSAFTSDKIIDDTDDFMSNVILSESKELSADDAAKLKKIRKELYRAGKRKLKLLRIFAIISFISGIAVFATFIGVNITNAHQREKDDVFEKLLLKNGKDQKLLIYNKDTLSINDSTILILFKKDSGNK